MIIIDDIMLSDQIVEEQFVCDLSRCKGGCCEDGDAGAPLTKEELAIVDQAFDVAKADLTKEGLDVIANKGLYEYDREFGWVTPTIQGKMCVYGFKDQTGTIQCAFEKAHKAGKLAWKKPISCHLYPIKITAGKQHELVNYEPREVMCSPACALGQKLKVPVYQFLKEALIRKYGEDFYEVLDQIATQYHSPKSKN